MSFEGMPVGGHEGQNDIRPEYPRLMIGPLIALATILLTLPWTEDGLLWPVIGWAIAAGGGLFFVSRFMLRDLRARSTGWYVADERVYRILLAASLLIVFGMTAVHSIAAADIIARSDQFAREVSE